MYGPIVHRVDEQKALQRTRDLERTDDDLMQGLTIMILFFPFFWTSLLPNVYFVFSLLENGHESNALVPISEESTSTPQSSALSVIPQRKVVTIPKPKWHPPWKLFRVISGHLGWVRCVAVEPGNEWFATGSADRVIKVSLKMLGYMRISSSNWSLNFADLGTG